MVKKYLKAFSSTREYISMLIVTALFLGASYLFRKSISLNVTDILIYFNIINIVFIYQTLNFEASKGFNQFSNSLPLGELIQTKKNIIEYIPVYMMLMIFSIIFERKGILPILLILYFSLGTLPLDVKDKDLTLLDKLLMGIFYVVVIVILGILYLTNIFNASMSIVITLILSISTAIFWTYYNNKYNVRRWRDD